MKTEDGKKYYTKKELEAHPKWSNIVKRTDDYSSTVYWYMNKPKDGLPPIQNRKEPLTDLP